MSITGWPSPIRTGETVGGEPGGRQGQRSFDRAAKPKHAARRAPVRTVQLLMEAGRKTVDRSLAGEREADLEAMQRLVDSLPD
jgi:hypothetical protein